jgi:hypothetical protein
MTCNPATQTCNLDNGFGGQCTCNGQGACR